MVNLSLLSQQHSQVELHESFWIISNSWKTFVLKSLQNLKELVNPKGGHCENIFSCFLQKECQFSQYLWPFKII